MLMFACLFWRFPLNNLCTNKINCWTPLVSLLAYLLFFRHKHLLGLFDHRLWLELILGELVFAGVKQLASGYTGQDQVSGIRLVVDIDLYLIRTDGLRCHSVLLSDHL